MDGEARRAAASKGGRRAAGKEQRSARSSNSTPTVKEEVRKRHCNTKPKFVATKLAKHAPRILTKLTYCGDIAYFLYGYFVCGTVNNDLLVRCVDDCQEQLLAYPRQCGFRRYEPPTRIRGQLLAHPFCNDGFVVVPRTACYTRDTMMTWISCGLDYAVETLYQRFALFDDDDDADANVFDGERGDVDSTAFARLWDALHKRCRLVTGGSTDGTDIDGVCEQDGNEQRSDDLNRNCESDKVKTDAELWRKGIRLHHILSKQAKMLQEAARAHPKRRTDEARRKSKRALEAASTALLKPDEPAIKHRRKK